MGVASRVGKPFVLTYLNTHQLIAMPDFWEASPPVFRDAFKTECTAAIAKVSPTGCCTETLGAVIRPVHDKIWDWIAQSKDRGASIDWAIDFITLKRGYRPQPIEVYYRTVQGTPQKFVI